MMTMCTGSEVPMILEKIEFLTLLKDNLKGIEYIDHKKYLDEQCESLEKCKDKIELDEYIENSNY